MNENEEKDFAGLLGKEIEELLSAIDRIPMDGVHRVEEALLTCKGRVLTSGAGTSSVVARKVAHTLNCAGTPTFFVDPTVANHGSAGSVARGDVLLLFTKGGETDELVSLLDTLEGKEMTRIAVTERPESTVGKRSDFVFRLPPVKEADSQNVIATTSILLTIAVFDAISMRLMSSRGYTYAEFARSHPGGAVGKRYAEG
jgi:D-arabinose 5-phosphate isomerase GutQ